MSTNSRRGWCASSSRAATTGRDAAGSPGPRRPALHPRPCGPHRGLRPAAQSGLEGLGRGEPAPCQPRRTHDGSSILERAMDDLITRRRDAGMPMEIVLPAGNNFLSRCHARSRSTRTRTRSSMADPSRRCDAEFPRDLVARHGVARSRRGPRDAAWEPRKPAIRRGEVTTLRTAEGTSSARRSTSITRRTAIGR